MLGNVLVSLNKGTIPVFSGPHIPQTETDNRHINKSVSLIVSNFMKKLKYDDEIKND